MLLVEKLQRSPHPCFAPDYRKSIGFLINTSADSDEEGMYLELAALARREAVVRLTDQKGKLLLQERENLNGAPRQLVYRINNLRAGVYYFEITDGFYYQVKEIEIKEAN